MQSPARLPVELYRPIIQQMRGRKDLYRLLFVSRAFCHEAERSLYSVIGLQGIRRPFHCKLFRTIASCERISLLVHHLFIFLDSGRVRGCYIAPDIYWEHLHKAFRAVRNLKKLYLLAPDPDFINLFSGCTFRLRILVIRRTNGNWNLTFDSSFLDSQTQLVKLDIFPSYVQHIPPHVFPNLSILMAFDDKTGQFITQPSVRALQLDFWFSQLQVTQFPISKHIKSLRLPFIKENFGSTMEIFPSLRFLQLDDVIVASQLSDGNLEELILILSKLAHLTRLDKLRLSFKDRLSLLLLRSQVARMCNDVFRYLSSLQVFTFEDGLTYEKGTCGQWLRDATSHTIVKRREMEWQDAGWD